MTSLIRELALATIQAIKNSQHFFTFPSRKRALKAFEAQVNNQNANDDEIIFSAMQQELYVLEHGRFGWRGPKGSSFLQYMDTLIGQYTHLQCEEKNIQNSAIKKLAIVIVQKIKKDQNSTTDSSRIEALTAFEKTLENPNITDKEIIAAAQKQKEVVEKHGKFGFWGRKGSTFLNKMSLFLEQATRALILRKQEVEEMREKNLMHPVIVEMRRKSYQPKAKRYVPSVYELQDTKRDILEEAIKRLLNKHFGKDQKISRAWRYRMDKVVTGEMSPGNKLFFENYAAELMPITKLPQDLRDKIEEYQSLVSDENYITARFNYFIKRDTETQQEIFEALRKKNKIEFEEEQLVLNTKTISRLFDKTQYSISHESDEFKIEQQIRPQFN